VTSTAQRGILAPPPNAARHLFLDRRPDQEARALLRALDGLELDGRVVGLGPTLLEAAGVRVPGARPFPALQGPAGAAPSTPHDLWVRVDGGDPGEVAARARGLALAGFDLAEALDTFQYDGGRDLSGYEDGTENPVGEQAEAVAFVTGAGPGLDGGSFLAVQRWVHDFGAWGRLDKPRQDATIGRERVSNEELVGAPDSAHVKRTAQEDFDPPAFLLRRSQPWVEGDRGGLLFLAFAASLDPFERQLRRMMGLEDGVVDALYRFTRPVSGASFWCPPARDGRLDLRAATGQG